MNTQKMKGRKTLATNILGISAYYHDSAAALLSDGTIIAAAQEERFTRKKHDASFPANAVRFCLDHANIHLKDIDFLVFYDKPLIKFERLLETYLSYAPKGFLSFLSSMPIWLKEKLFIKKTLKQELLKLNHSSRGPLPKLMFTAHHQSHAASAFFPSPFDHAAVLCLDGVGEWATTSVWSGKGNCLIPHWEIHFPHSLGLLYSAFTYHTGFKVNSGEYKLMGLAPYGEPVYVDLIYQHLIHAKSDGSFCLNMDYFNYAAGLTMTSKKFDLLFGGPPREPESRITQKQMDMARSIQVVTEEVILNIARNIKQKLGIDNLCLAGGVALNCVANSRLIKENIFKNIWVQPASGDAGGAVGSAYSIWYEYLDNPRTCDKKKDETQGSYLGPSFNTEQITAFLDSLQAVYQTVEDDVLLPKIAAKLAQGYVVGWFQGRMEFGPRALGNRSILGDPRNPAMQSEMNLKIKFRESFRPFAPSVNSEAADDWFEMNGREGLSPFMLVTADVKKNRKLTVDGQYSHLSGIEKHKIPRSTIPAVTHVDGSARVQTVHKETNPRYWTLIHQFNQLTGCPVLINTSFNVRGEPIVCSPKDAYHCFMRTHMDYMVMENILLAKTEQPLKKTDNQWKLEFTSD